MEFVIQLLKEKKKEIQKDYELETDFVKVHACKLMTDKIDKAIKTLEYEYYWKHFSEKQIDEIMGIRKIR
jgi:hypothetical protein